MADENLRASLFGPSPEEVAIARRAQDRAYSMQRANIPLERQGVITMGNAGAALGRVVGNALGGRDPAQDRAAAMQEAKAEVMQSGISLMDNPQEYYKAAFVALSRRGLNDEAARVRDMMMQENAAAAQGRMDERKLAAEELTAQGRAESGRASLIKATTPAAVEPASPVGKILQDYSNGIYGTVDSPEAIARRDEALAKANYVRPADSVTVNTGVSDPHIKKLAETQATNTAERYEAAIDAPNAVMQSMEILEALKDPNIILGPGAPIELGLAKFLNVMGADNEETIKNTQTALSGLASATLAAIKTSGLGTGQGFTEKDKIFLQQAAVGDISFTREAIADIAIRSIKARRYMVDKWNQRLAGYPPETRAQLAAIGINPNPLPLPEVPTFKFEDPTKKGSGKPPAKAPKGVSQDVWERLDANSRRFLLDQMKGK